MISGNSNPRWLSEHFKKKNTNLFLPPSTQTELQSWGLKAALRAKACVPTVGTCPGHDSCHIPAGLGRQGGGKGVVSLLSKVPGLDLGEELGVVKHGPPASAPLTGGRTCPHRAQAACCQADSLHRNLGGPERTPHSWGKRTNNIQPQGLSSRGPRPK